MALDARRCWSCGATILARTASSNFGRCRRCSRIGWYGRLWEVLTGVRRKSTLPSPAVDSLRELRQLLGLTAAANETVGGIIEDLVQEKIAFVVDWRSDPDEILDDFSEIRRTAPPSDSPEGETAAEVVAWLAGQQRARGLRLVNLQPGTDGWLLAILSPEEIPRIVRCAKRTPLGEPFVL